MNRHINRHCWDSETLAHELDDESSPHARVLKELTRLIAIRRDQPAFHPNATQFTLHMGAAIFAFWRQSIDRKSNIFCLHNITDQEQSVLVASINLYATEDWLDLVSGELLSEDATEIHLAPYQCIWLVNRRKHLPY